MESYCSLCTLDTIHRFLFVTRLIINKTNKVQWGDFKLENVLVSLHSLKTMGLGSIIFKEWRVTYSWTSCLFSTLNTIKKIPKDIQYTYDCKLKTIREMLLTTLEHNQHDVIDVIWRLPVWNVKITRYLASCTLQVWYNLTRISFQGKLLNYFCVLL